jgi:hypothetical protein
MVRLKLLWYALSAVVCAWLLIHPGRPNDLRYTVLMTTLLAVIITRSIDGFVRTLRSLRLDKSEIHRFSRLY